MKKRINIESSEFQKESKKAFEAKAQIKGLMLDRLSNDERYESMETEHAWQGWQEAISWLSGEKG